MNKEPRLRFTDEERSDPALEKPIRKADKAAAKADKAQAKIPKKQVRQKTVDPETGKVTTKLVLEDKKKPPSKLSHAVRDTPANAALGKVHKEIRETEQDNVGVESAHKSEEAAETGARLVREGYRSHKLKPYRKAAQAEQKLETAKRQSEAQLKLSKAQLAKMEVEELKGKLHRSEDVEGFTEDLIYTIRAALLSLPGRLSVDVTAAQSPAEAAEIIRKEVHKVMRELAAYHYDPEKYAEKVNERRDWSNAGRSYDEE